MLIKCQRECASFTGSSMSTAGVLALSADAAAPDVPSINYLLSPGLAGPIGKVKRGCHWVKTQKSTIYCKFSQTFYIYHPNNIHT